MEDFHRQAAQAAAEALGAERYATAYAVGVNYMKAQLNDLAHGGSVRLRIP
jgi:hypothetical protein